MPKGYLQQQYILPVPQPGRLQHIRTGIIETLFNI